MEIKQKHGKHALRKAVTAAVLAGTAFSSLGGFAGAVTTVKADELPRVEEKVLQGLFEIIGRHRIDDTYHRSHDYKKDVETIRELLENANVNSLIKLLNGFDQLRPTYATSNTLHHLNNNIGMLQDGKKYTSFTTLLIEAIQQKIKENEQRGKKLLEKESELEQVKDDAKNLENEKTKLESKLQEKTQELAEKEAKFKETEKELSESLHDFADVNEELEKVKETVKEKEASVKDLTEKLETSKKNHAELAEEFEKTKGEYEKELSENDKKLSEAAKQNSDLVTENKELKENLEMAEGISDDLQKKVMKAEQEVKELSAQLEAEKEALEAEKAKLAESEKENAILSEERDAAKKEAEKVPELEEQVEKLVEEITAAKKEAEELQAKAEALEKDFEAVKAEKEKLEAEIAKMKEDHQKEVDALNALLADKETMLKNLQDQLDKAKEEAMKNEQMSQEEKAKLQAELDKAKQELAEKIKDMPNKVAPQAEGKANAGQAAPNQNQNNQAQANQAKNANNLPSTGDKPVNPLLVASGLSLMIGAGAFVYAGKRKKG